MQIKHISYERRERRNVTYSRHSDELDSDEQDNGEQENDGQDNEMQMY